MEALRRLVGLNINLLSLAGAPIALLTIAFFLFLTLSAVALVAYSYFAALVLAPLALSRQDLAEAARRVAPFLAHHALILCLEHFGVNGDRVTEQFKDAFNRWNARRYAQKRASV